MQRDHFQKLYLDKNQMNKHRWKRKLTYEKNKISEEYEETQRTKINRKARYTNLKTKNYKNKNEIRNEEYSDEEDKIYYLQMCEID